MIDLRRAVNGIRKIGAGLRPFSESVWPGVRNDLFVAHESIYAFFAQKVRGLEVLDAGCGTGYGSRILADAGARRVTGVDLDRLNVRYARRHYFTASVSFEVADMERLSFAPESFDAAIATNSVEHLRNPAAFLESLARIVRPGASSLLAVPPIYDAASRAEHESIRYHRSNLTIAEWIALLESSPFEASFVIHRPRPGVRPDVRSRRPSNLSPADFEFVDVPRETLLTSPTITAMFLLRLR